MMNEKRKEIIKLIRPVLWDVNINVEDVLKMMLDAKKNDVDSFYFEEVCIKLLSSYNWYKLIDVLGIDFVKKYLLKTNVINKLYPESLQKSYIYVKERLLH